MHLELAPNKRYYSIGEIAKAFDVNASLIRFWDKEFDILKPKKNAKGNRMFTPEDVKNLQLIYHLVKEKGYTLVPLKIYFKKGKAKLELGLASGKKNYDKRQDLAEKDAKREIDRAFKERQRDY